MPLMRMPQRMSSYQHLARLWGAVEADPVANDAAGALQGLDAMTMCALLVSGLRHEDFLQQGLFDPLCIKCTNF